MEWVFRPGRIWTWVKMLISDWSIMIGDALSDMQAAQAAGFGKTAMVRTGRGIEQTNLPEAASELSLQLYDGLQQALEDLHTGSGQIKEY